MTDTTTSGVDGARARRVLEAALGIPATEGNAVERLRNGERIFPSMLAALRRARHSIDLTTFVYWQGDIARQVADVLCERARAGVRVRVVLDAFGAREMDGALLEAMRGAGVHILWFRPARQAITDPDDIGHRTHRKVLVVDEELAFTGGVGIAAEWEGDARDPSEWRDSHFRIRGPAVDGLRAAFLDDWLEADDQPLFDAADRFPDDVAAGDQVVQVVRGEAEHGHSDIALLKHVLLTLAQRRVRLTSGYFSPEEELVERLCETAARGVEIELLIHRPGPDGVPRRGLRRRRAARRGAHGRGVAAARADPAPPGAGGGRHRPVGLTRSGGRGRRPRFSPPDPVASHRRAAGGRARAAARSPRPPARRGR